VAGGKVSYVNNAGPFFHTVEIYHPATNSWAAGSVIRAQDGELETVNHNGNLYTLDGTNGTYRNYNFQVILPPTAPAGLKATAISSPQINLTWTDNAKNEANYIVERASALAGPFAVIAPALAANSISYHSTGLTANTDYYYRVKATNTGGNSIYSNVAFDSTFVSRPAQAPATIGEQQRFSNSLLVLPNPVSERTNTKRK
jgi:hypothetical protein